jgi:hypothetical protein
MQVKCFSSNRRDFRKSDAIYTQTYDPSTETMDEFNSAKETKKTASQME